MQESMDKMTVQIALIIVAYIGAYLLMMLLGNHLPGMKAVIYGFNFLLGVLAATLIKNVLHFLENKNIVTRKYTNSFLLNHISNLCFDVMIVAGIASIEINDLKGNWLPFLLMAVLGGVVTFLYLRWVCKKLYPGYHHEGFLSMYGMLTGTISSGMYQEKGIMPSKKIAGLLCSAIISDTVMFKSPTCTPHDKVIAERMARIAEVTLEEVGNTVFAGADLSKPVDELIFTDFKEFLIADHKLGIGQVTCLNSDELLSRQDEMLAAMKARKEDRGYDYILIMLTDVLKEGTELLYIGDDQTITNAYGQPAANNAVFLPHVMSRKKQIVPRLSELWG